MRGLVAGLFLLPVLVIAILSIRPGGLRQQLRFLRRRFKLAMVLAGIYLATSTVSRLLWPRSSLAEWGQVGIALVLGVTFLVLAQDPATPPAASASPRPRPPAAP